MKSLLFATMYLNDEDDLERYKLYIDYYLPRLDLLGCQKIAFIDDGSDMDLLEKLNCEIIKIEDYQKRDIPMNDDITIFTFKNHLGRPVEGIFPGWWRSFSFASILGLRKGINRLIHIESDSYVLTNRLFDYMRDINDRWWSLYCHHGWFPETCFQIIPESKYYNLLYFFKLGMEFWYSFNTASQQYVPELRLPIEDAERFLFKGDRYGEDWCDIIPDDIDYISQTSNSCKTQENYYKYRILKINKIYELIKK